MKAIPIKAGEKYGRLTVMEASPKSGSAVSVLCRCACGTEKRIRAQLLRNGQTKSCGCIRSERGRTGDSNRKHGLHSHPLYQTWNSMIRRCSIPTMRNYADYGGRGIRVCDRWQGPDGLKNFITDMGPKPSPSTPSNGATTTGITSPGTAAGQRRKNRNVTSGHVLTGPYSTPCLLRISSSGKDSRISKRNWPK